MIVDALVPVKSRSTAKSRLAGLLVAEERAALVRAMLQDVLETLLGSKRLRRVVVTSPAASFRCFAEQVGAFSLAEPDGIGLNGALALGLQRLENSGSDAVLVLPADLPALARDDICTMLEPPPAERSVRAAPSYDGGTGALLLSPPSVIAPAFGPLSFARHRASARAVGAVFESCERPALAADVDGEADLRRLLRGRCGAHTHALLLRLGLAQRLAVGVDSGTRREGRP